jgi:hypothetical protein
MLRKKKHWILAAAGLALLSASYWWFETATRPQPAQGPDTGVISPVVVPPSSTPTSLADAASSATNVEPSESGQTSAGEGQSQASNSYGPTVGDILSEPDDNYVRVAKKLAAITLNPRAPMVEREEALAHALNLSAGNEQEVLTPLIKDPNLPDELADTILAEALNRPLAYQADLYLIALAERKSPELQTKIREHLAFLTGGEDKGANPADWAEPIKAARAEWAQ